MLKHRVIPALLLRKGGLVKTVKFRNPKYVGDPINAIKIFNEKEVDELMVLDIEASKRKIEPDYQLIELFAGECFMPLCYGGGVSTLDQASRIFSLGVEKICIQTAAFQNPRLITSIANKYGSQAVVVSVDIKKNWFTKPMLYQSSRNKIMKKNWRLHLSEVVEAGAGEILFNSVDNDGTMRGPDLDLIRKANEDLHVPLIAMGGIGSLSDMKIAVEAGASAVAAGAFFVFNGPHRAVLITYPNYKELENLFNCQL